MPTARANTKTSRELCFPNSSGVSANDRAPVGMDDRKLQCWCGGAGLPARRDGRSSPAVWTGEHVSSIAIRGIAAPPQSALGWWPTSRYGWRGLPASSTSPRDESMPNCFRLRAASRELLADDRLEYLVVDLHSSSSGLKTLDTIRRCSARHPTDRDRAGRTTRNWC